MFKIFCVILGAFFFQQNLRAEADLRSYSDVAIGTISSQVDKDSIRGWESHRSGDEVAVKVFLKDGRVLEFHCEIVCAKIDEFQIDFNHVQNATVTLDFIAQGRDTAFNKLEKTLQRKGIDLGALDSYKVWVYEETEHGHDHGLNVWTQMVFEKRTVFVICHPHGGQTTSLVCHYRSSSKGELLGEEEEHDHDHDHDHDEEEEEHHHGHKH